MIRHLADELAAIKGDTCDGRCPHDIWERGRLVVMLANPRANVIEAWVKAVSKVSGERANWHFAGGRARVLTLEPIGIVDQVAHDLFPALEIAYRESQGDEENGVYVYWPEGEGS